MLIINIAKPNLPDTDTDGTVYTDCVTPIHCAETYVTTVSNNT